MAPRADRRRWLLLAALGLAFYAAFLLMTAPAFVVAWGLQRLTGGAASLERPHGSLWRGHAALVISVPGGARHRLRELKWRVMPSRLLRGQLAVSLTLEDEQARGAATIGWQPSSLRLLDAAFTIAPAALLAAFPTLQLARPGGEIKARSDELTLRHGAFHGQAEIEWTNASSALTAVEPLGTYRAKVRSDDTGAKFEVTTQAGALQIEGRGAWSPKTGPAFAGTARTQPASAAELRNLLRLLGPEDSTGVFRIRWGSL